VVAGCSANPPSDTPPGDSPPPPLESANGLKAPAEFSTIEDDEARARAVFDEMAKVLQHPRCLNCHPAGQRPFQGDAMKPHQPLVVRGKNGRGAPGMRCDSCHGSQNFLHVPGSPHWHLAPAEMAWVGRSTTEICEQLKDPERNGGKSLEQIVAHMGKDPLVAWGWSPPDHLEPAPGNQRLMEALTRAWVDAGAHCP